MAHRRRRNRSLTPAAGVGEDDAVLHPWCINLGDDDGGAAARLGVVQINGEEDDVVAASLRCAFQSAVGTTAFPGRRDMAWRSDGARCGPRRPVGGQPCSGCAFPSFFFVLRSCLMSDDAGCHGLASAAWCGGGGGSSRRSGDGGVSA
uniref:Uncharacterized protein n=1 Tax=Oryza rufipogon TaxID=4529 RepID=A0A0E0R9E8_ORYRU